MDKKTFPGLLLSALALLCWCAALFFGQQAGALAPGVAVRWSGEGGGISPAALARHERWAAEDEDENFPELTLWREKSGLSVTDGAGDRAAAAGVLELFGDGNGVWPVGFLSGNYPARGDSAGCAVDRAVAESLWGGADAVGNEIKLEGRTYRVRGVFEGTEGLVLTQAAEGNDEAFSQGLMSFPDGTTKSAAESWLLAHDAGGGEILDLPLLRWCWMLLASLPGFLLALGVLLRLGRRGWALHRAPLLLAGYLLPALAAGAAALWCAGGVGEFPARLIPDRWSDFGFWAKTIGELGGELKAYLAAPGTRDFRCWGAVLSCILTALPAAGLTVLAAERIRVRTERGAVLGAGTALLSVFACALLFAPMGGVELPRGVWLLPAIWLWSDWALWRHGEYLKPGGDACEKEILAQTAVR
ncbi:MAG: hypothetical protein EOM52_03845 [Clostridia bacterium]|nr:hypothetical protein [Clostridia bacterium]